MSTGNLRKSNCKVCCNSMTSLPNYDPLLTSLLLDYYHPHRQWSCLLMTLELNQTQITCTSFIRSHFCEVFQAIDDFVFYGPKHLKVQVWKCCFVRLQLKVHQPFLLIIVFPTYRQDYVSFDVDCMAQTPSNVHRLLSTINHQVCKCVCVCVCVSHWVK